MQSGGEQRKTRTVREILKLFLKVVGVIVLAAYIGGIVVMYGRFQENTSVNGVDVSHMTAEEAEEKYRHTYEDWSLTVKTIEGNEEIIDGDEIAYALAMNPTFPEMVRHQNYLKWPFTPFLKTDIKTEGSAVFDDDLLTKAIASLKCVSGDDIRDPVDAHIGRAEDGGYYELVEADDGNRLNAERTHEKIAEAISSGAVSIDLDAEGCYEKASLYADDETLKNQFAPIDEFQQTVINIDMMGGVTESLTKEIYGSWLDYDMETGEISVSSDLAYAYGVSLYNKYSTFGHKRKFKTNAGDIIEVGGSTYDCFGYEMDLEPTAAAIRDALVTGQSQDVECTWIQLGAERNEIGSDFGNSYIEISLDEQHLWYYIDGELIVSTGIVSGLATPSRATPCGCFMVLDKLRDHTMEGTYGQAYAQYVIAIMFNGICIHDSSWRDEYGGDIWLYDGSHGCINTPLGSVSTLYENVWYGVPVVIYDRADTVPEVKNELYSETDSEIARDYAQYVAGGEDEEEEE